MRKHGVEDLAKGGFTPETSPGDDHQSHFQAGDATNKGTTKLAITVIKNQKNHNSLMKHK